VPEAVVYIQVGADACRSGEIVLYRWGEDEKGEERVVASGTRPAGKEIAIVPPPENDTSTPDI
jgi:hypothetical protein